LVSKVRTFGDEHLAIGLRAQQLRVAGPGEAKSENPGTGSLQLFVGRGYIADRGFALEGRIEIVGK
jgi:hypothetical protein